MTFEPERVPPNPVPEPRPPFVAKNRIIYLRELSRRLRVHVKDSTVSAIAKKEIGYAAEILDALADQLEEEDHAARSQD